MPDKDFYEKYTELRTLCDAIAMESIRFCLQPRSTRTRKDRLDSLLAELGVVEASVRSRFSPDVEQRASADAVRSLSAVAAPADFEPDDPENSGCPNGYYRCGAACMPCPCPDGSN